MKMTGSRHAASGMQAETERVRRLYERAADRYDRAMSVSEKLFFGDGRAWVSSRARGEVLEVAAGTGRNLPYYPEGTTITAVEISPAMLEIARRRAHTLGVDADLREGDAQSLDFTEESFDTVVFALSLCTIPDDRKALAEAHRVLKPGGRLLLLEHVASSRQPVRAFQRLLEPLTVRLQADHLLRDPLVHLREMDFEVKHLQRSKWGVVERLCARKPHGAGATHEPGEKQ